ncbi:MAG: hypothetical protein IPM35_18605 [Myxococcales bacterium]|nr:hypothetical protein [Myxococcales bacterium]
MSWRLQRWHDLGFERDAPVLALDEPDRRRFDLQLPSNASGFVEAVFGDDQEERQRKAGERDPLVLGVAFFDAAPGLDLVDGRTMSIRS